MYSSPRPVHKSYFRNVLLFYSKLSGTARHQYHRYPESPTYALLYANGFIYSWYIWSEDILEIAKTRTYIVGCLELPKGIDDNLMNFLSTLERRQKEIKGKKNADIK